MRRRLRCFCTSPFFIVLVAGVGCARASGGDPSRAAPQIALSVELDGSSAVEVVGLPPTDLDHLRHYALDDVRWSSLLWVTVIPGAAEAVDLPAVAGSYAVRDQTVVFTPRFGFDPGQQYRVTFDPSLLPRWDQPVAWRESVMTETVARPKEVVAPTTVVSHVYPTRDVVPENQLRMYFHFSAPMGRRPGLEYVRLLDDQGRDVIDPFLPLDVELWNGDRTRFTVFFDPGRVKRGILPNEEMGRSLTEGRAYTLVVSPQWLDAASLPLREEFRRTFRVGPPDEAPLDEDEWHLETPMPGSRDSLVVTFPEPLDHGLLRRALGVVSASGLTVAGEGRIVDEETRWVFNPNEPWAAGEYRLRVLAFLEDLAGNRIGRAFEVDRFDRADSSPEPESVELTFRVN